MRGRMRAARESATRARVHLDRVREDAGARTAFDLPTSWRVAAVIAVGVGATALFGGLAPATPTVATVAPSDALVNEIVSVRVLDVWQTDAIPDTFVEADEGNTLLVATFTVTNLWSEPLGLSTLADRVETDVIGGDDALVQLSTLPDDVRPEFFRTDGSRGLVFLQPELPVDVTGVWELAVADLPTELTLTIHEAEMRRGSVLIAHQKRFWLPGAATGEMTVPVRGGESE